MKKSTFPQHPATAFWRAHFVNKSDEGLQPFLENGSLHPDLLPYCLSGEMYKLHEISEEIEKINNRISGHTQATLLKMVKALPGVIDVPGVLVQQIVDCIASPGRAGKKKQSEKKSFARAEVANIIMALAMEKKRRGHKIRGGWKTVAMDSISAIWGENRGATETDKTKEIRRALKPGWGSLISLECKMFSDDEIKKPLPGTVADYLKLKKLLRGKKEAAYSEALRALKQS